MRGFQIDPNISRNEIEVFAAEEEAVAWKGCGR
jgi:hypothetical protein